MSAPKSASRNQNHLNELLRSLAAFKFHNLFLAPRLTADFPKTCVASICYIIQLPFTEVDLIFFKYRKPKAKEHFFLRQVTLSSSRTYFFFPDVIMTLEKEMDFDRLQYVHDFKPAVVVARVGATRFSA